MITEHKLKKLIAETLTEFMECQPPKLMDTKELADLLKVQPNTLEIWRSKGKGPAYHKDGGFVSYSVRDVNRWLNSKRCGGAA